MICQYSCRNLEIPCIGSHGKMLPSTTADSGRQASGFAVSWSGREPRHRVTITNRGGHSKCWDVCWFSRPVPARDTFERPTRSRRHCKIRGLASEVQHLDVLKYTNNVFRHLYSKAYIDLVNKAPEVLGWLYDHLDVPGRNEKVRLAFDRLNTVPFIKFLNQYQPDVAICTHFLPSEIISWLKREKKVNILNAVVVTDLDVHAMWLCRECEHYFVALEETKVHLVALGVPESKVTISGIPIDPVFSEAKDPRAMRRKHGLERGQVHDPGLGGRLWGRSGGAHHPGPVSSQSSRAGRGRLRPQRGIARSSGSDDPETSRRPRMSRSRCSASPPRWMSS